MDELKSNFIECHQGEAEADELIVEKAVNNDSNFTKIIVAEDIDILIILTARAKSEEVFFEIGQTKYSFNSLFI